MGKHRKLPGTHDPAHATTTPETATPETATPETAQAPAPSRRRRRITDRRERAALALHQRSKADHGPFVDATFFDAVAATFDEDGFYVRFADRILDRAPWHVRARHKGHGLCVCLHDLAAGLEARTYAKLAQTPLREALLRLRFPRFLAEIVSSPDGFGDKPILGGLPSSDLAATLAAATPLVCPDLDRCPARGDVLATYTSPALARRMRAIAAA